MPKVLQSCSGDRRRTGGNGDHMYLWMPVRAQSPSDVLLRRDGCRCSPDCHGVPWIGLFDSICSLSATVQLRLFSANEPLLGGRM